MRYISLPESSYTTKATQNLRTLCYRLVWTLEEILYMQTAYFYWPKKDGFIFSNLNCSPSSSIVYMYSCDNCTLTYPLKPYIKMLFNDYSLQRRHLKQYHVGIFTEMTVIQLCTLYQGFTALLWKTSLLDQI